MYQYIIFSLATSYNIMQTIPATWETPQHILERREIEKSLVPFPLVPKSGTPLIPLIR